MTPLWAMAAGLPILTYLTGAVNNASRAGWLDLSRQSARAASIDALLLSALCMMAVAPIAAVAITRQCRPGPRRVDPSRLHTAVIRLAAAIGCFVLTSALLAAAIARFDSAALPAIAVSHATLGAGTLALAAVGVFFSAVLRNPLDAAAASLAVTLTLGIGILLAGPGVSDLPRGLVNAALAASPLVASASAANIDLLRTDMLYHVSPIAHFQFEYPAWYTAVGLYSVASVSLFGGTAVLIRTSAPDERMVR